MKAWFSVKGWKAIEKEVELIAEGDENKGCFPHCTSRRQKARQKVMKYQRQCWDIKSQVQKLIGDVRLAYINEIFFLTREEMKTKVNVRRSNPLFYEYDACPTDAWIAQLRHTAKKRATLRWQSVTDRVTSAWGAYDVQDEECTGILESRGRSRHRRGTTLAAVMETAGPVLLLHANLRSHRGNRRGVAAEAISELTAAEQARAGRQLVRRRALSGTRRSSPRKNSRPEGPLGRRQVSEICRRCRGIYRKPEPDGLVRKRPAARDALENAYFDSTGELVVP